MRALFTFYLSLQAVSSFKICSGSPARPVTTRAASNQDEITTSADDAAISHFLTPPMQVFIEDTDAYGIMYNANYLRAYDRALHTAFLRNGQWHGDWSIVSVTSQKFKASPALGSSFVVEGNLQTNGDGTGIWDLSMKNNSSIYNTVTGLTISRPPNGFPCPPTLDTTGQPCFTDRFQIFRDEFDSHLIHQLPLRTYLNLFERCRSNIFGGPQNLQRLQQEGVLFVVASINDLTLVNSNINCKPGIYVDLITSVTIKRNGMITECRQTAFISGSRAAQGVITLVAVDTATRKPTSNLPSWALERFSIAAQGNAE